MTLIIGGIILLLVVVFLMFRFRGTKHHSHLGAGEKDRVVKPNPLINPGGSVSESTTAHEYPPIILKRAPLTRRAANESSPLTDTENLIAAQTTTRVKESTDKAHHKEVEIDIVHLKPASEASDATAAEPKSRVTNRLLKPLTVVSPKRILVAPASPRPRSRLTLRPIRKAPAPASHTPPAPARRVPDWQSQLTTQPHQAVKDPPDMFEVAAQHPETFGNYQVLETNSKSAKIKKDTK